MLSDISPSHVLSANLRRILDGVNLEESVLAAEQAMRECANHANSTQRQLGTRPDSDWLKALQAADDSFRLAQYTADKKEGQDNRVFTFAHQYEGTSVEFAFKRKPLGPGDVALALVDTANISEDNARVLLRTMLYTAYRGREFRHPSEFLLGKESRTLDNYVLARVSVVTQSPWLILGYALPFLKTEKRDIVYTAK